MKRLNGKTVLSEIAGLFISLGLASTDLSKPHVVSSLVILIFASQVIALAVNYLDKVLNKFFRTSS